MKKIANILLTTGTVLVLACTQPSMVSAEIFSFSKTMGGTIADVRADVISLTPSNPAQNGSAPIDLEINDSTKFKDLQAVTDLKPGDAIQVKYKEQDGKKVAVQVEKDNNVQERINPDLPNTLAIENSAEQNYRAKQGAAVNPGAPNNLTPVVADQSAPPSSEQPVDRSFPYTQGEDLSGPKDAPIPGNSADQNYRAGQGTGTTPGAPNNLNPQATDQSGQTQQ